MNTRAPNDSITRIPELDETRFAVVEKIGSGGMGTVYKAIQKSVGRPVAIKYLAPEHAANASGVARFVREANVISRLAHPNIVSVIDFGRDRQGNLLMVMELLDGEPLRTTIRRHGQLPIGRAVAIAMQVLAALRIAHGAGCIHRDLKPDNVFLCRVDGVDHAKVLDFGVAKLITADGVGDHQTTAGGLVGTLRYMAPEQIAGDAPDGRVDLYAVGMLLYEMITGTLPYDSKDKFTLLRAVINDPPVPIGVRAPDAPAPLCAAIMRAIEKAPDDRFATADEMRAAIAPFASADAMFLGTVPPGQGAAAFAGDSTTGSRPNVPSSIGRMAPPPSNTSTSLSADESMNTSAARPKAKSQSGLPVAAAAVAATPSDPGFDPANHGRVDFTTAAGVSTAARMSVATPRRAGLVVAGGLVVGALVLGSSAALLYARAKGIGAAGAEAAAQPAAQPAQPAPQEQAAQQQQGQQQAQQAQQAQPQGAGAVTVTSVMLRSEPAGATVRDSASGNELCTATPCTISVAGVARRVTVTHGAQSVQAVLEPGIPSVFVDLPTASAAPGQAQAQAQAPQGNGGANGGAAQQRAGEPARARQPVRRTQGVAPVVPLFGPRQNAGGNSGGGAVPMFRPSGQ